MSNHFLSITGYLGKEVTMRYTPNGTAVSNFTMATTRKWTNSDGEKQEETVWFQVSAWGRQAETVNEYLGKGDLVQVHGRLKPNEYGSPRIWTTKDGDPRANFEVTAERVDFLKTNGSGEPTDEEVPAEADQENTSIPV